MYSFSEKELRAALADYSAELCADDIVYDPGHVFSESYKEQMRRIFDLERRKPKRRITWQAAAAVLAAAVLGITVFTSIMAANGRPAELNKKTYSNSRNICIETFMTYDDYGETVSRPAIIPEGFELVWSRSVNPYYADGKSMYRNSQTGEYIRTEYYWASLYQLNALKKKGQRADKLDVWPDIDLFCSISGKTVELFWKDPRSSIIFKVRSNMRLDSILAAYGSSPYDLPAGDPKWLPEGYRLAKKSADSFWRQTNCIYSNNEWKTVELYKCSLYVFERVTADYGDSDVMISPVYVNDTRCEYRYLSDGQDLFDLVYIDRTRSMVFVLSGDRIPKEDAVRMLESIE